MASKGEMWFFESTASHSHIVKPGQARMTLNCTVVDSGEGPGGAPPTLYF